MIRVLHLTTASKISGAEKVLLGIAKKFDQKKFELCFCTLKEEGDLHRELEKLGQKAFTLNCTNIFCLPAACLKLNRIVDEHKIDILHTHLYHASVLGQFLLYFKTNVKGVLTRHHSELLYLYGNGIQRRLERYTANSADKVIAISKAVRKVLVDLEKIDSGKISVIYNGIDIEEIDTLNKSAGGIREEFSIDSNVKIVAAIGSLHPCKGHRYLIEAANIICQKRNDVKFFIIGDGPLKKELVNLAHSFGLEDKIIFTSYRRDAFSLLSGVDIVVQPSIDEGLGLSIIEAMYLGKPVIATDVGGIPEIIENKRTGILIPSKDSIALADAIQFFLINLERAKLICLEAKKVAQSKFNLMKMVREYEMLYEALYSKSNFIFSKD